MFRFECGIMVLKYLEHWEPNKKYNGQSMPTYSGVSSRCKKEIIMSCIDVKS